VDHLGYTRTFPLQTTLGPTSPHFAIVARWPERCQFTDALIGEKHRTERRCYSLAYARRLARRLNDAQGHDELRFDVYAADDVWLERNLSDDPEPTSTGLMYTAEEMADPDFIPF